MKDIRFAYFSKPTDRFRCTDIEDILAMSRHNNARMGVTGLLVQTPSHFMQVLEGSREAVSQTFGRIVSDPRHTDVTFYGMSDIDERHFSEWRMAFVGAEAFSEELCRRLFGLPRIIPSLLSHEAAMALFYELAADEGLAKSSEEAIKGLKDEDFFEISI